MKNKSTFDTVAVHVVGWILSVGVYLLPLLFLLMISLKTTHGFLADPLAIPVHLEWGNFVDAWQQGHMTDYFLNSVIYTVFITGLSLLLSVLAAFPVARNYLKFSNAIYLLFVISLFLPGGLIPLFTEALKLHLFNSRIGYIILNLGTGLSFFFFVGYIKSIPKALDEAAALDGCGYFRFVFQVLIPLLKPALATMGLLDAIGAWNNLIGPVVFLSDQNLWPLTRGLFVFYGQFSNNWPLLAAAVIIVMTPMVLLFIFLQRYIVQAAGGAIKQ
ncbi:sugar ABC transporter permease [Pullulanibacillus camelliae]|uniref:Sugar ABC transporter permease n=1 Tax=Pullulanibacillus camelliae TaxID=1707096 RepID=A0A8J2VN25_9BACL|nr:carbohydrate ABC transporter permease [Pullulanibacillus camelliae]GGE33046.1 sugar ABC transporter permease [Pullulanibacillus camelliae]